MTSEPFIKSVGEAHNQSSSIFNNSDDSSIADLFMCHLLHSFWIVLSIINISKAHGLFDQSICGYLSCILSG